jgi:hypothetical protein
VPAGGPLPDGPENEPEDALRIDKSDLGLSRVDVDVDIGVGHAEEEEGLR